MQKLITDLVHQSLMAYMPLNEARKVGQAYSLLLF